MVDVFPVSRSSSNPFVSIVVPVRNEAANIAPLVREIEQACIAFSSFEVIYVNDGSSDTSLAELQALMPLKPWLRVVCHATSCGQSAAVRSGVLRAHGQYIVTLDGDGQNDPAFIPALVGALEQAGHHIGLAAGHRQGRKDGALKSFQSRIANKVRKRILNDGAQDTGCGLKAFPRDVYLKLPYFDALHRFMPALVQREGYEIVEVPVKDRPRMAGQSNYGLFDRLWVGIMDMLGVWWLIRRKRICPSSHEVSRP